MEGIDLRFSTSTSEQIRAHLDACDKGFVDRIKCRINLQEYATKLDTKAHRFEAWADDKLVGLLALYIDEDPHAGGYISNLSVVKQYERQGIGSLLLRRTLQYMKEEQGGRSLALEVTKNNYSAIAFYQKNNFKETSSSNDSMIMTSIPVKSNAYVSVIVVTYNHVKNIAKCLDSIIEQETDIPYEVIVADDASNDGTTDIVKSYAERYPAIIVPIIQKENIGPGFNFQCALDRAQSKYIAYCDGDDYWCHSKKLEIATKTLDQNPDCTIFVHNTDMHDVRTGKKSPMVNNEWAHLMQNSKFPLTKNQYTHISARVFRNMKFPNNGDTFMYHYLLSQGNGYYHNAVMSVYNYDGSGIWSKLSARQQKRENYKILHELNSTLEYKYDTYYTHLMPKSLMVYKIIWGAEKGWEKFINHHAR